ncbi:MAG: hypothetical protein Q4G46_10695, partial [Propionibacteriaceae bacterium]|nr:hypothetical protein [Propionibacteriaceae bacterium]
PFLPALSAEVSEGPAGSDRSTRRAVVFAAQALVPAAADQRRAILAALAQLPARFDPVVKVRALAGERQAHNEDLPYAALWTEMEQPRPISFVAGSMAAALADAVGFVTVSSTAALEAIAAGVPALVLDEFGVTDELINTVFAGSGLLGGLDRLIAGDFAHPRTDWLHDNYFHPRADDTWVQLLTDAVRSRHAAAVPATPHRAEAPQSLPTRARRLLRVLPPGWVWQAVRRVRRSSG